MRKQLMSQASSLLPVGDLKATKEVLTPDKPNTAM